MKKYLITLVVLVLVLVAGYFYWQQNKPIVPESDQVACTMEAKICSDGQTYVGRTGPRCEFEACPFVKSSNDKNCPAGYGLRRGPSHCSLGDPNASGELCTADIVDWCYFIKEGSSTISSNCKGDDSAKCRSNATSTKETVGQ